METTKATPAQVATPNHPIGSSIPQLLTSCDGALSLAAFGLYAFPCRARGKEPLTEHGSKDATTDPDIIRAWWERLPDANIGIACGPSGIVVIDIDSDDAVKVVKEMGLPHGPHVRTSQGWHVYTAADPVRPLASRVGILPGVDIRAQGGYVIAPPSVHPSGKRYEWAPGRSLWDLELPAAPEWLYAQSAHPMKADIAKLAEGAPEGMRDASLTSVCGHLLARRVEPHLAEALVYAYGRALCDPPLSDKQIGKVWTSIATRELRRRQQRGLRS